MRPNPKMTVTGLAVAFRRSAAEPGQVLCGGLEGDLVAEGV
jgi:hypothetical protein